MTSPWGNPPPRPNPPRTRRHEETDAAALAAAARNRHCQYCGDPAEIYDVDGAWCTPQHQTYDRQSESTYWRKAVDA